MDDFQWDQWGAVMTNAECLRTRSGRAWRLFLQLLPAGIPAPLRGKVWQELCGAADPAVGGARSARPDGYSYMQLVAQRSPAEDQILKDVPRTLPQHPQFAKRSDRGARGQATLFNVVRAFSLHDDEVGYCQGITSLAAMLLLANSMDEEAAFSTLCALMSAEHYGPLRRQFVPGMPMLQLRMWQLERLLHRHLPRFSSHLSALGVLPTTFASEWFLTLFAQGDWPTEWVARVWDLFLVHGVTAIFAIALAVCSTAESLCCASEPAPSKAAEVHARESAAGSGSVGGRGNGAGAAICTRRWDFDRTVTLLRHGMASQCCMQESSPGPHPVGAELQPSDSVRADHSDGTLDARPDSSGPEPYITPAGLRLLSSAVSLMPRLGVQKHLAKLEKEYASTVDIPSTSQAQRRADASMQLQDGDLDCTSTAMRQRAATSTAAGAALAATGNCAGRARATYTYTYSHNGVAAAAAAAADAQGTGRDRNESNDGSGNGSVGGYPGAQTAQVTAATTAAVRRRIVEVKRELARSERRKQHLMLEIADAQAETLQLRTDRLPALRSELGALKSHDMAPTMQPVQPPPTPPRPW